MIEESITIAPIESEINNYSMELLKLRMMGSFHVCATGLLAIGKVQKAIWRLNVDVLKEIIVNKKHSFM